MRTNAEKEKTNRGTDTLLSKSCPSRKLLELLADKWKLLIIHCLADGERRNGQIKRAVEGISQKMLTQTLRSLERDGFVVRTNYQELPPRVGYNLTGLGTSLRNEILRFSDWGIENFDKIVVARAKFDAGITGSPR